MSILKQYETDTPFFFQAPITLSLKGKMILAFIPSAIIILIISGYLSYLTSLKFINIAIERTVKLQVKALSHEIESLFARCKQDLLFISQEEINSENILNFMDKWNRLGREYHEIAYISLTDRFHIYYLANGTNIVQILPDKITDIRPNPLLIYESMKHIQDNEVWISNIMDVEYPIPISGHQNQIVHAKVIYFAVKYKLGFLLLSIDSKTVRNILSLYNSKQSPIWAYERTPEIRYSYFFDKEGWILFQSEDPKNKNCELSTDLARTGYMGTLGKPGMPSAFRPASINGTFWKMVSNIREGKIGLETIKDDGSSGSGVKEYQIGYAPIRFSGALGQEQIYAGVAYLDRTRLTLKAGFEHIDVMLIIAICSIVSISIVLYFLGNYFSNPIMKLTEEVNQMIQQNNLHEIQGNYNGYESTMLKAVINNLIVTQKKQLEEIRLRDKKIEHVMLKEKACLKSQIPESFNGSQYYSFGIIGIGPKIEQLKSDIIKASTTDLDVLIIGETGTGKQLTAEAIHTHSKRSDKPFICINCGELSENLLLDTLFGHIKGAFTEAKADRKGAFLEAEGGTLFLDEIQTASPFVQQSLLRAIAMRKIRPLGSDKEFDVNVRVIAATNVELKQLIDQKLFRSDLYFRLKVITIHTPSLREMKENIPILINHFMEQAKAHTNKVNIGLSKGALEKLKNYHWPGNVRELMNTITRAVVMAEREIIQADDINLEYDESDNHEFSQHNPSINVEEIYPEQNGSNHFNHSEIPHEIENENTNSSSSTLSENAFYPVVPPNIPMNNRQQKAYPIILKKGIISRSEYQEIVGNKISIRTATYDLQDLVNKGLLRKTGKGPATRYEIIPITV